MSGALSAFYFATIQGNVALRRCLVWDGRLPVHQREAAVNCMAQPHSVETVNGSHVGLWKTIR